MKPAPAESTAELLHRVRQQLILSQVRIMELEDERDELAPRLAATATLLTAAQTLADQKIDEAGHLETVRVKIEKFRAELQENHDYLRHMQHVTNEALNATRAQLATSEATAAELQRQLTENSTQLAAREFDLSQHQTALAELQNQFDQLRTATTTERLTCEQRLAQLDEAARRLQASRSWRWTAWLRALERPWGGR
jgi:chromosome segregation ATPase